MCVDFQKLHDPKISQIFINAMKILEPVKNA